jgi:trehalose synthase
MSRLLGDYAGVAGEWAVEQLRQLAGPLKGSRIVHVNSTRTGGGVAEILEKLVPLTRELGLEVDWEVVEGDEPFYRCTKGFHNGLQGDPVQLGEDLLRVYEETNAANAERLRPSLEEADFVMIHDPQPAALIHHFPGHRGKWVWRCHIDLSHPHPPVWAYVRKQVLDYDASIFSLASFAQLLPHPQYLIPPSIDPLSEKNRELPDDEVREICRRFELDRNGPLFVQVSRFDRFKDPVGVIRAYQLARRYVPGIRLVLAGGTASDDPEGEEVLAEVREAAGDDPHVHILLLPPDAHRIINALQRGSSAVLQKSLREGFGLTVTEAMWKGRPVIGGNTGGIRLQVAEGHTGFLVGSPQGAALRMRQLAHDEELRLRMGRAAHRFVRDNFLLTRLLREHLTVQHAVVRGERTRLDLTAARERS